MRFAAIFAFISSIFRFASSLFASTSFAGAAAGGGGGGVAAAGAPFDGAACDGFLVAASFAFTAAIRAAASCFFLSISDMPFAAGAAGAGDPLLERMRLASLSLPPGGKGLFPVELAMAYLIYVGYFMRSCLVLWQSCDGELCSGSAARFRHESLAPGMLTPMFGETVNDVHFLECSASHMDRIPSVSCQSLTIHYTNLAYVAYTSHVRSSVNL